MPMAIPKLKQEQGRMTLIDPAWLREPWYSDLHGISTQIPWPLSITRVTQNHSQVRHPNAQVLLLMALFICGYMQRKLSSQQQCRIVGKFPQERLT